MDAGHGWQCLSFKNNGERMVKTVHIVA
jgi:hypothetical protein